MAPKNIAIVSAWGRGAWLVHQLKQEGFDVTVLDVSSLLPSVSSSEREGPLGVFLPSGLSDLQKQYLLSDNFHSVKQGFSVYTSQGPVEFQGPLYSFLKKKRKDFYLLDSFLSDAPDPAEVIKTLWDQKGIGKHKIEEMEDPESLVRLALELGGSYSEPLNIEKLIREIFKTKKNTSVLDQLLNRKNKACSFSPLFSDYFLREASQRYFEEVKNSLRTEGVQWLDVSQQNEGDDLKDLEFTKKCVRFRLKGEKQEVPFLIWTLSGPETARCFSKELEVLFPDWKEPVKIWRAFSLAWDRGGFEYVIPSSLIILPSLNREKENNKEMISLKKHKSVSHVDMWTLCPYSRRFDEQALGAGLDSALNRLRTVFPHFSIKGFLPDKDYYQEYYVQYESRSFLAKNGFYNKVHPRLYHLNPEAAGKVDAYSLLQQSDRILKNILIQK